MIRTVLATAATLAASGVLAAPALAHVTLEKSSPKAHSTVSKSLRSVSLTFSGPLRSGTLKITGPGGTTASTGAGGRDPRNIDRLLVALRSGLKPGRYTAHGSTVAADGHKQTWSFWFKLK